MTDVAVRFGGTLDAALEVVWGDDAQDDLARLAVATPVFPIDGGFVVAGPEAVSELLHDAERFANSADAIFLGLASGLIPMQIDPPEHSRYRKLLDPLFSPQRMSMLRDDIKALVNRTIDDVIEAGSCDFGRDIAEPIPSKAFLRLFGLPTEGRAELIAYANEITRPGGVTDDEKNAHRVVARKKFFELCDIELDRRLVEDNDDLLSRIAGYERAGQLTRDESLSICVMLLIAALDTVADSLQCAIAYLARHPAQRDELVARPELVDSAVEELMRWSSILTSMIRVATTDTELGGVPIPKGSRLLVVIATSNFDPTRFPDPMHVDFDRDARRHLGFGTGIHRCLGSHLARIELRVTLAEWHRRVPDYVVPSDWSPDYTRGMRGIRHIPLSFTPGRRES